MEEEVPIMKTTETGELEKREKVRPVSRFEEMEKWFEDVWTKPFSLFRPFLRPELRIAERYEFSPSVDIYYEGNELVVKADVPGIDKKDLDINLTENILTISGEKKKEEKVERENYYRFERSHGSFRRTFEMPGDIDPEKVKAHFEDGVLEIRIPRTEEAIKKRKKIPIS